MIIAVLQLLTYYYLDFDSNLKSLLQSDIWLFILGSVLISGAGYLFNDWIDVYADKTNKPHKVFIEHWNPIAFWATYCGLSVLGLIIFYFLNPSLLVWFTLVVFVMLVYSLVLKRLPLVGNIVVSLLAAFSVYVVYLHFGDQERTLVVFFASFAALLTYIRELIKDIEDIEGDGEAGYRTFAVLSGIRQTKVVITLTTVFTVLVYANLIWKWIVPQFSGGIQVVFIAYQLCCVVVPLAFLAYFNTRALHKEDFTKLSALAKYIMATGMCSMMFF